MDLSYMHNTIGMNGGYANAGLNWINQSYVQGGNLSNYLSLEGKSLTGLIMAGSMGYSSMILKQAAVGAADPWLNVTLDNGTLKNKGYLLNFSSDKPTLQKTTALSVIGAFGPLCGSVPLFNNGALNFGIQQLMLTPAQKAINEKK